MINPAPEKPFAKAPRLKLWRRIEGMLPFYGARMADLGDIRLVDLVGENSVLGLLAKGIIEPTPMYGALDHYMADFKPGMVILDVLADLFSGEESNRTQVTQFMGLLKRLGRKHDCTPLTFEGKKNNYGEIGGKFDLIFEKGLFRRVTGPTGFDKMAAEAKEDDVFLTLLKRFNNDGRKVSDSPGANYAAVVFSKLPESKGITKEVLRGAMERLFEKKAIRVETSGPPSRQTKRLAPA